MSVVHCEEYDHFPQSLHRIHELIVNGPPWRVEPLMGVLPSSLLQQVNLHIVSRVEESVIAELAHRALQPALLVRVLVELHVQETLFRVYRRSDRQHARGILPLLHRTRVHEVAGLRRLEHHAQQHNSIATHNTVLMLTLHIRSSSCRRCASAFQICDEARWRCAVWDDNVDLVVEGVGVDVASNMVLVLLAVCGVPDDASRLGRLGAGHVWNLGGALLLLLLLFCAQKG